MALIKSAEWALFGIGLRTAARRPPMNKTLSTGASGMKENILTHGLASQLLASLDMFKDGIDRCPEKEWNGHHEGMRHEAGGTAGRLFK